MRRPYLILSIALAVAALVVGAVLVAMTLGDDANSAGQTAKHQQPKEVSLFVSLSTSSPTVARNHDDRVCVWIEPSYTLRDDGDRIIAAEKVSTQGAGVGGSQWAAIGTVTSAYPNFKCVLQWSFKAPPASFYQLEVMAGGGRTVKTTISHSDADEAVVLEID